MNQSINAELLIALLSYDPLSGEFHWKRRPREFFKSDGSYLSWNTRNACRRAGVTAFSGVRDYLKISVLGTQYFAHRLAWIITHGSLDDDLVIDHINGDGLDNRIENLRICTVMLNNRNRAMSESNYSGKSGVTWCGKRQKWFARIGSGANRKHVGYFDSLDEAVAARSKAEQRLGYHENHGRPRETAIAQSCNALSFI